MIMNWTEIETIVKAGLHSLLFGPPGTGKTRCATSPDSYSLTLTPETPAAELRGHFVPKGHEFVWFDGPAMRAWREGKRLVLNEIDQASGDALTFLYAVLDDPDVARLTLPTGETVRPAPGFHAVATTNATDLHNTLPAALLDRFAIRIEVTECHPAALERLPQGMGAAVASTMDQTPERRVTLRQAMAMQRLSSKTSADLAARAIFGARSTDVLNSLSLATAKAKTAK